MNAHITRDQILRKICLIGSSTLLFAASANANAELEQQQQCFKPAEKVNAYQPGDLDPGHPIVIRSDSAEGVQDERVEYQGNVSFSQGIRTMQADQVVIDKVDKNINASGALSYEDHVIAVKAASLSADMQDNQMAMTDTEYRLQAQPGRGKARVIKGNSESAIQLIDASFTTCPQGDSSWQLEAQQIHLDMETEWGTVKNAVFNVAAMPVLYIPYMTFPLTDKRKSGLLYPDLSVDSSNGFDYKQPYYWNIAPEMDATIAPRWLSKRGLQLQTELRSLTEKQFNQFNIEYLADDAELTGSDTDRYLGHWKHKGKWDDHWYSHVDYTTVSDDNYFNDLGSDVASKTDNRIKRSGQLAWRSQHWEAALNLTNFKVFGDYDKPYKEYPRINFQYRDESLLNQWEDIDFTLDGEYVHFTHGEDQQQDADRLHFQPRLHFHRYLPSSAFEAETRLYQTLYIQSGDDGLKKHKSRTLPMLRLAGKLNLERQVDIFDQPVTQTLEPQVQYLYVPHDDQSDIGLYDTNPIQDDFYGLFRSRRFTGLDRIADANQVTLGVTSRLLDSGHREQAKFSIGQILYLENSRVGTSASGSDDLQDNRSALAMSLDVSHNEWSLHAQVQQDSDLSTMQQSELLVDYAPEKDKLVQLSYHYTDKAVNLSDLESSRISQLGLVASWPLRDNVKLIGSFYRDLNLERSIDTLLGVEYETCCWAVRLMYQRNINTSFPDEQNAASRDAFDSGLMLNFVLKGLGGSSTSSQQKMIEKSVFGYRQHYYLNN